MGSQVPSLALSAHDAGVSSNPSCCWVSPQPAHGKLLHTHSSERRELPREPVSSPVTTQYFANQIFNPCTRGGTRGGNKNTNNRIFGGQTLPNGALGFAAGFAGAALVNSALGNPCG